MKGISLLGGLLELILEGFLNELKYNNKFLSGADRDSLFLVEKGLTPDVAAGGFDSLRKTELTKIEKVVKDICYSNLVRGLTDSELMIETASESYYLTSLKIYDATDGRLDHFLVNLFTFLRPEFRICVPRVTLVDRQSIVRLFSPGRHHAKPLEGYSYLGIANLTEVKNPSIRGAKYPLEGYTSAYSVPFAFNEFVADKSVELYSGEGTIAVTHSKDPNHFVNL